MNWDIGRLLVCAAIRMTALNQRRPVVDEFD
jgi:hypothetical protein